MGIRRLFLLLFLLASWPGFCHAQTAELSGNVANADGSPFSGSFVLALGRSTVTNICSTPVQIIPFKPITIPIVNGVVTATTVYTTDCLQPRLPYYVTAYDTANRTVFTDNWYVPNTLSGDVDVGTLIEMNLAPAITVSVPQAIVANPSGAQTITQPGSTYLNVNNLNVTGSLTYSGTLSFSGGTVGSLTVTGALNAGSATIGTLNVTGTSTFTGLATFNGGLTATSITDSGLSAGFVCSSSGGLLSSSSSPCAGGGSVYYQTIYSGSTAQAQSVNEIFGPEFSITSPSSPVAGTQIDLATTGVSAGTYASPSSITVNSFGQVTSITGGSGGSIIQATSLGSSSCSPAGSSYSTCTNTLTWPTAFSNTSYRAVCSGEPATGGGGSNTLILYVDAITSTSQLTVTVQNNSSDSGTYFPDIFCIGIGS